MKKRFSHLAFVVVALVTFLIYFGDALPINETDSDDRQIMDSAEPGELYVHFIDVGQGDSTFIELPNGEKMLIDAGELEAGERVVNYIKSTGAEKIDYVVATHPHSDHIGGLADVINSFETGKVYMPNVSHTSRSFENLLDAIEENDAYVYMAKTGAVIYEDKSIKIHILSPVLDSYEELNDFSAVVKIQYKETSFLFTGDAEMISEEGITEDVSADVLKVGHHGSKTSTSKKFLERVMPQVAVISVGADNSYGHPSGAVLKRLNKIGAQILRTDEMGDIVISSDGENIRVRGE